MAGKFRVRRDTLAEWTAANPTLAEAELVVENPTTVGGAPRFKIGDGITPYNQLPYASMGSQGIKGDKGDFLGITDLMGHSTSSLTISEGVKALTAPTGKSWVSGMYIMLSSTAAPDNYLVGQITDYSSSTGSMTCNVDIGGFHGVGTFSDWNISYAPGAGVVYSHANWHLPGGSDPIPEATDSLAGLLPAELFTRLSNINTSGVYIQDTQPVNFKVGEVWFRPSQGSKARPAIAPVLDQYILQNSALDIPIILSDDYNVSLVSLTYASSNTAFLPLSSISKSGTGSTRTLHIAGTSGTGESIVTVTAYDYQGQSTSIVFLYKVVAVARTITASTYEYTVNGNPVTYGSITPTGSITVGDGGSITFSGTGDDGYALDTLSVDGGSYVLADSYTFSNVTANHSIIAKFGPAWKVISTSGVNGSIVPAGNVFVCNGHDKTFTFLPNEGYQVHSRIVDGVETVSSNTSFTMSAMSGNRSIAVTFSAIAYTVTKTVGAHGVVSGPSAVAKNEIPTFTITPDADYEVAVFTYNSVVIFNKSVSGTTGTISSYNGAPASDNITLACTFQILLPNAVAGFTAADYGSGTRIDLAWTANSRALDGYLVYWSTNGADTTAAAIVARGNTPLSTSGTSVSHTGLTEGTTYRYTVIAINAAGSSVPCTAVTAVPTANIIPTSTISGAIVI